MKHHIIFAISVYSVCSFIGIIINVISYDNDNDNDNDNVNDNNNDNDNDNDIGHLSYVKKTINKITEYTCNICKTRCLYFVSMSIMISLYLLFIVPITLILIITSKIGIVICHILFVIYKTLINASHIFCDKQSPKIESNETINQYQNV